MPRIRRPAFFGGSYPHSQLALNVHTVAPAGQSAPSPAPAGQNRFPVCVHYYTREFGEDRWAVHYYAAIRGHELVTRRDLIPAEPDRPRAGQWYYKLQLGPLQHKIPPIVSAHWRRITFIVTSGDRFMQAAEINDLFEQESPARRLYVKLLSLFIKRE